VLGATSTGACVEALMQVLRGNAMKLPADTVILGFGVLDVGLVALRDSSCNNLRSSVDVELVHMVTPHPSRG